MAAPDERFDSMLLGMAQTCGGIEPILHTFLAFLARRTDFFHIQDESNRNTGFPPGVAKQMLLKHFNHFEGMSLKAKQGAADAAAAKQAAQDAADVKPPPEDVTDTYDAAAAESEPEPDQQPEPAVVSAPKAKANASVSAPISSACTYNGAVTDKYTWSQTLYETTVEVPVPAGIKGKDIKVDFSKKQLEVTVKGQEPIIKGELGGAVKYDDCTWIKEGTVVQVTLVKEIETWWKSVVVGDPEIDTQKVDSVRNISEYDDETQAGIQKVMFDQDQKRKGLPSSEELTQQDLLRKAWDAEGSPFAGQAFDPSVLNMSGGLPPGMAPP